jgi:hypothetical protein
MQSKIAFHNPYKCAMFVVHGWWICGDVPASRNKNTFTFNKYRSNSLGPRGTDEAVQLSTSDERRLFWLIAPLYQMTTVYQIPISRHMRMKWTQMP